MNSRKNKINIFYLSHDVAECVQFYMDRHIIKMILETSQLLSTAHRVLDGQEIATKSATGRAVRKWILPDARQNILYSATHINHPSAVWVRKSKANYSWLCELNLALCKEYTYRYGKIHKTERDGLVNFLLENTPNKIPKGPFTEPTPAMPDDVKVKNNSIASYRNYYIQHKQHLASWSGKLNNRNVPNWFTSCE